MLSWFLQLVFDLIVLSLIMVRACSTRKYKKLNWFLECEKFLLSSVWQNLPFADRIRMASQGDFRSSKALLTNQELRLKQQRQQIVGGLC